MLKRGSSPVLPGSPPTATTSGCGGTFLRVFRSFPSWQEGEWAQAPWVGEGVADVAVEGSRWVTCSDQEGGAGYGK